MEFEYFHLGKTKEMLKIAQDDKADDVLLSVNFGPQGELYVKNNLKPFAGSFPLSDEDQETAELIADMYAASRYKEYNNNLEAAKSFLSNAKEMLDSLVVALKSQPTIRTRIVAASPDYDTEESLFSQQIK